jgi:hypothetical protein
MNEWTIDEGFIRFAIHVGNLILFLIILPNSQEKFLKTLNCIRVLVTVELVFMLVPRFWREPISKAHWLMTAFLGVCLYLDVIVQLLFSLMKPLVEVSKSTIRTWIQLVGIKEWLARGRVGMKELWLRIMERIKEQWLKISVAAVTMLGATLVMLAGVIVQDAIKIK